MATRYGLDGPGIKSLAGEIFHSPLVRFRSQASVLNDGHTVFPEGKLAGACVLHPPTSIAEVKEKGELYICFPFWAFTTCSNVKFTLPLPISL